MPATIRVEHRRNASRIWERGTRYIFIYIFFREREEKERERERERKGEGEGEGEKGERVREDLAQLLKHHLVPLFSHNTRLQPLEVLIHRPKIMMSVNLHLGSKLSSLKRLL